LEILKLRHFVEVVKRGSLRRTAVALGIEQSTLSRSIARLEDVVGLKLLVRSQFGVSATIEGVEFARNAKNIISMIERMLTETRLAGQTRRGRITIGHASSISAGHLRISLEKFREEFSDVEAMHIEAPHEVLLAGLDTGVVDVAVMSGDIQSRDLRAELLWNERLMAALPSSHPLADRHSVAWTDLGNETFVLTANDPGPGIGDMIRRKLYSNGRIPVIEMLNTSRESMLSMLGVGKSISILCACATGATYADVAYREVRGANGQSWVRYSAFWRGANDNPALRHFLDFVRKRHALSFELP
jgi:DNA-binding transcriptional LysR family regulator